MKLFFGVLLLGLALLSGQSLAQQQVLDYEAYVELYEDVAADGSIDIEDTLVADWPLQLFDSSFALLTSELSEGASGTLLSSLVAPSFVCVAPASGYIQTYPATGMPHPDDSSWVCTAYNDQEVYDFAIALLDGEPEDIPEVLGESNVEPDEKQLPVDEGLVLGATSPEVLAETGTDIWVSVLVGISLITLVFALARRPQMH